MHAADPRLFRPRHGLLCCQAAAAAAVAGGGARPAQRALATAAAVREGVVHTTCRACSLRVSWRSAPVAQYALVLTRGVTMLCLALLQLLLLLLGAGGNRGRGERAQAATRSDQGQ